MKWKALLGVMLIFAVLGIAASVLSYQAHFEEGSTFCSLNETFDCDVVNRSSYSEMFGIPVSLFGIIAYVAFFLYAGMSLSSKKIKERYAHVMMLLATVSLAFSLYLTSIEAFVLETWCVLCIMSQVAILAIFVSLVMIKKELEQTSV